MTIKRRKYGTGHAYYVDDPPGVGEAKIKLPGVTTILSATMPKDGLVDWSARCGADEVINYWTELRRLKPSERHDRVHHAYRHDRDTAARRGTEVHQLAEALNNDEPVRPPDELRGHVEAYRDWLDAFDVQPVKDGTELVVASRTHRYCGTVDLVADLASVGVGLEIFEPSRWLIEIKTTRSGVWPESALQACGYSRAEMYVHPDHPDDEQPMDLLGIKRCAVVWLKSDAWEFRPVDTGPETWEYFLHLRWLFDHQETTKGWVGYPAAPGPAELTSTRP
jgi:hypothetical protein